jgi:hypothetical protein
MIRIFFGQKMGRVVSQIAGQLVAASSLAFMALAVETFLPNTSEKVETKISAIVLVIAAWIRSL